jgi:hypothetical protein
MSDVAIPIQTEKDEDDSSTRRSQAAPGIPETGAAGRGQLNISAYQSGLSAVAALLECSNRPGCVVVFDPGHGELFREFRDYNLHWRYGDHRRQPLRCLGPVGFADAIRFHGGDGIN